MEFYWFKDEIEDAIAIGERFLAYCDDADTFSVVVMGERPDDSKYDRYDYGRQCDKQYPFDEYVAERDIYQWAFYPDEKMWHKEKFSPEHGKLYFVKAVVDGEEHDFFAELLPNEDSVMYPSGWEDYDELYFPVDNVAAWMELPRD